MLISLFKTTRSQTLFWFSLSLTLAAVSSLLILQRAFSSEYVVQDDVRQHVFWMLRFSDPSLFPQDLIADYFQSLAPWGYRLFYQGFAAIGLSPLLLSKLLPVGLSLVAAGYAFGVSMQLLPVPFAGFVASALTSQVLWTHDDVVSATPRAFLPPLFLAFLYYLLRRDAKPFWRRSLLPCLVVIGLEGLFYPQYVLVFAAIAALQVVTWQPRLRFSRDRQDYLFCGACLGVAFGVLLPIALSSSPYGAVISAAEARQLPEFSALGRSRFFSDDPLNFWLVAERSGLFPNFRPWLLAIGAFLPLLLRGARRHAAQFPLVQQVSPKIVVLLQVTIAALALFFAAHLLLFRLYLPSRYAEYTLRFVLVFAAAIGITILLQAAWQRLAQSARSQIYYPIAVWVVTAALIGALLLYPSYGNRQALKSYWVGGNPQLYQFFAQQPQDILIAALGREADNIPTFAQRSLLVGREYALPYQVGYGSQFRQRVTDTIQAQYALEPSVLANFIRTYGIDFWVLDQQSFDASALLTSWLVQYPEAIAQAQSQLAQGTPALKKMVKPCTVSRDHQLRVLSASCILAKIKS
ncbi:MAG: hypothetical protein HY785_20985 [Oscillatoriophycideae cyanobacterium NC_groundwater_1537_Pr4_S-0.65um_50_18]|nr:hypothetical protein [Oscillatoriophycideae cyanobacterium NC_groundwater_1537_Pr4_S-0.65um_50_18]